MAACSSHRLAACPLRRRGASLRRLQIIVLSPASHLLPHHTAAWVKLLRTPSRIPRQGRPPLRRAVSYRCSVALSSCISAA
ncbi:hypothetical protein E2C01_087284 [Portunus trituberculatus]|uniref:Uncharacterized protein n=1 Tax=Portunus trituberculatus TaxID=210409 RepID=A0A5B7JGW1_PORTR|nr:hypothetical protein [Portunus trituberculatus]